MKYMMWIVIVMLSACGGEAEVITQNDILEPEYVEENEGGDPKDGGFSSILQDYVPDPDIGIDFTDYSLNDFLDRDVSSDSLDGTWIAVGYSKDDNGFHLKKRMVFQIDTSQYYKMNDCYRGHIPSDISSIRDKVFVDSFVFTPTSNTSMSASINDDKHGTNSSLIDWEFTAVKISDNNTYNFIEESIVLPAYGVNKRHQFASCFVESKIQSSRGTAYQFYSDSSIAVSETRIYSRSAGSAYLESFYKNDGDRSLYLSSTSFGFDVKMVVSKSDSSGVEVYIQSNNNYSNHGLYKSKMTVTIPQ